MAKPTTEFKVILEIGHGAPTAAQLQHWRMAWKALSEMSAPGPAAKAEAAEEDGKVPAQAEGKAPPTGLEVREKRRMRDGHTA